MPAYGGRPHVLITGASGFVGRAYAEEHFSLLKCADQYEELFAELKEEYKIP